MHLLHCFDRYLKQGGSIENALYLIKPTTGGRAKGSRYDGPLIALSVYWAEDHYQMKRQPAKDLIAEVYGLTPRHVQRFLSKNPRPGGFSLGSDYTDRIKDVKTRNDKLSLIKRSLPE